MYTKNKLSPQKFQQISATNVHNKRKLIKRWGFNEVYFEKV